MRGRIKYDWHRKVLPGRIWLRSTLAATNYQTSILGMPDAYAPSPSAHKTDRNKSTKEPLKSQTRDTKNLQQRSHRRQQQTGRNLLKTLSHPAPLTEPTTKKTKATASQIP